MYSCSSSKITLIFLEYIYILKYMEYIYICLYALTPEIKHPWPLLAQYVSPKAGRVKDVESLASSMAP